MRRGGSRSLKMPHLGKACVQLVSVDDTVSVWHPKVYSRWLYLLAYACTPSPTSAYGCMDADVSNLTTCICFNMNSWWDTVSMAMHPGDNHLWQSILIKAVKAGGWLPIRKWWDAGVCWCDSSRRNNHIFRTQMKVLEPLTAPRWMGKVNGSLRIDACTCHLLNMSDSNCNHEPFKPGWYLIKTLSELAGSGVCSSVGAPLDDLSVISCSWISCLRCSFKTSAQNSTREKNKTRELEMWLQLSHVHFCKADLPGSRSDLNTHVTNSDVRDICHKSQFCTSNVLYVFLWVDFKLFFFSNADNYTYKNALNLHHILYITFSYYTWLYKMRNDFANMIHYLLIFAWN